MKILLTGVTGYIGKRLLPELLAAGHEVVCCVRDKQRFDVSKYGQEKIKVLEVNFLVRESLDQIPDDLDVAYYLIHSMSASTHDFDALERQSALDFRDVMNRTQVKQVIYLSGIINDEKLSKHLQSRKTVEEILSQGHYALTTLRAGIIIGSGGASFEIIRDLVEKLPIMIAPKWLNTRSQPIAVRNVIEYLLGVLMLPVTFGKSYDIGGPEILSYRDMLLKVAEVLGLKRNIITVPVMTPRLSSYWLYFVTSTSYKLAVNLVNSMKVEVICHDHELQDILKIKPLNYTEAVKLAYQKTSESVVPSSWKDALSEQALEKGLINYLQVPEENCYQDRRTANLKNNSKTMEKIWVIGGRNGWYYGQWLWAMRGILDKMVGGVGLRRGRRDQNELLAGDALDFWRVIYANKTEQRLLLYAEMKLPGEAWLEFKIKENTLHQTATFRPRGKWGKLYWYSVWPFHQVIFRGLIHKLAA